MSDLNIDPTTLNALASVATAAIALFALAVSYRSFQEAKGGRRAAFIVGQLEGLYDYIDSNKANIERIAYITQQQRDDIHHKLKSKYYLAGPELKPILTTFIRNLSKYQSSQTQELKFYFTEAGGILVLKAKKDANCLNYDLNRILKKGRISRWYTTLMIWLGTLWIKLAGKNITCRVCGMHYGTDTKLCKNCGSALASYREIVQTGGPTRQSIRYARNSLHDWKIISLILALSILAFVAIFLIILQR